VAWLCRSTPSRCCSLVVISRYLSSRPIEASPKCSPAVPRGSILAFRNCQNEILSVTSYHEASNINIDANDIMALFGPEAWCVGLMQNTSTDDYTCPGGARLPYPQGRTGFTTNETLLNRGYPLRLPPDTWHGSQHILGWSSRNGWVRNFFLSHNTISLQGEAKHGLWHWTKDGVLDGAPQIWWCHLGSKFPAGGNGDGENMDHVWKRVAAGIPDPYTYGPLASSAGLGELAETAVRVYQNANAGAHMWMNHGSSSDPMWKAPTPTDSQVELYIVRAWYDEPGFFDWVSTGPRCPPDHNASNMTKCSSLHDFIFAVIDDGFLDGAGDGLPSAGLHYGPLETGGACPEQCGNGTCHCNRVLIDLSVVGTLNFTLEDPLFNVPDWGGCSAPDGCSSPPSTPTTSASGAAVWTNLAFGITIPTATLLI
jgi:hypothetical protein